MKVTERLRKAVDFIKNSTEDKTNEAIIARLGYDTPNYLADILGGSKRITPRFLKKLNIEYSINPNWVLAGIGQMITDLKMGTPDNKKVRLEKDTNIKYYKNEPADIKNAEKNYFDKKIPVFESSPATLTNVESYRDEPHVEPDFYLSIPQYRQCDMITRARGDSMHPLIRNMALVGGKRVFEFNVVIFGDIYIIHTSNGIETIKYVHPHETDPDQILLVPYNDNAKSTPIHKSEILRLYQAQFVLNPL